MIKKETIGEISLYTLTNASGAAVKLSSLGAGVLSIFVPDRDGRMADVVLGYANPVDYISDGPCAGKTPGRYANRIGEGHLEINGKLYQLAVNNGPNHLHGGSTGFQNRIWHSAIDGDSVVFSYRSVDGEENYPGNLDVKVSYKWNDNNSLSIEYKAESDAPTVINLTNHTYFNLSGHNSGSVLNHYLHLCCSRWLPTDESLCPTGDIVPVAGTPMDFTTAKQIVADINADFPALRYGKGYDNCFVIDDYESGVIAEAATLSDHESGRSLKVYTDQPGVQVYTGNWLEGCPAGKEDAVYHDYCGVAIECQGFPDAPNKPQFPSQFLNPGETYCRHIIFEFKTY